MHLPTKPKQERLTEQQNNNWDSLTTLGLSRCDSSLPIVQTIRVKPPHARQDTSLAKQAYTKSFNNQSSSLVTFAIQNLVRSVRGVIPLLERLRIISGIEIPITSYTKQNQNDTNLITQNQRK